MKTSRSSRPVTEKARIPTCSRVRGTLRSPRIEDRREASESTLAWNKHKLQTAAQDLSLKNMRGESISFPGQYQTYCRVGKLRCMHAFGLEVL